MHANAARTTFRPRPFDGWALKSSCRLATYYAPFLAHVNQASPVKRQAVFAAL